MKCYCISGLGADERVFSSLSISLPMVHLLWIEPQPKETLTEYAHRMAHQIPDNEDFVLMGLSLGGMIATEISKIRKPKCTILLSSAIHNTEIPTLYRVIGAMGILPIIPANWFTLPMFIAKPVFGVSTSSNLLKEYLKHTNRNFLKWAVNAIAHWKTDNALPNSPVYRVHGTADLILPRIKDKTNTHWVKKGTHLMVLEKPKEVSQNINEILQGLN